MTYKTELSQKYFPRLSPEQALRQLKTTIRSHPELLHELEAAGCSLTSQRHYYTPREVEIIQRHLGVP